MRLGNYDCHGDSSEGLWRLPTADLDMTGLQPLRSGHYYTGSGATQWYLPPVASTVGFILRVKNQAAFNLTLHGYEGSPPDGTVIRALDGSLSHTHLLLPGASVCLVSDGTHYQVVGARP